MTEIKESKLFYPAFKFFKEIYTKINISDTIHMTGNSSGHVDLYFENTEFCKVFGKLTHKNPFTEWLIDGEKHVVIYIENCQMIGKLLKKNTVGISYDPEKFIFEFLEEDVPVKFSVTVTPKPNMPQYSFQHKEKVTINQNLEIFELFLEGETLVTVKGAGRKKLLEVPTKNIPSVIHFAKDITNFLCFAEIPNFSERYLPDVEASNLRKSLFG